MSKREILVDTQLLVLLIVGSAKASLIARHKRTKTSYTRTDFDLLLDLLGFNPKFLFCPHVAAEVSNLVGQHGEPDRSLLMSVLKAFLSHAREAAISSTDAMNEPEYIALGLADAVQLALRTPDAVLSTDDEPLFRAASARGLATLYFRHEKFQRDRFLA